MNNVNGVIAVIVLSLIAVLGVALANIPTLGAFSYSFIQQQNNLIASTSLPKSINYDPKSPSVNFMGIDGTPASDHIDVYTTPQFQNCTYTAGNSITIPLTFEYVSPNNSNTTIHIDSALAHAYYICYSSNGTIILNNNEPVQISVTINYPKGLWPHTDNPRKDTFNLYAIDSFWPIVAHFTGVIEV